MSLCEHSYDLGIQAAGISVLIATFGDRRSDELTDLSIQYFESTYLK